MILKLSLWCVDECIYLQLWYVWVQSGDSLALWAWHSLQELCKDYIELNQYQNKNIYSIPNHITFIIHLWLLDDRLLWPHHINHQTSIFLLLLNVFWNDRKHAHKGVISKVWHTFGHIVCHNIIFSHFIFRFFLLLCYIIIKKQYSYFVYILYPSFFFRLKGKCVNTQTRLEHVY